VDPREGLDGCSENLSTTGIRSPDRPAGSVVAIPITLFRLTSRTVFLKQTMFLGYTALELSVLTLDGTCNVTSYDECFVPLHQHFPKLVPSAQHSCNFSSSTRRFRGKLSRYFLNAFEIILLAPITTGVTFVLILHMRCFSIVKL
jgi:hypothetical protein